MSKRRAWFVGGALGVVALGLAVWLYLRDSGPPPVLPLNKGDRIVILGNTFAERMQLFGHFETLLHSRFPEHELVVRNIGYSGDEITNLTRPQNFSKHGTSLGDLKPNALIACFGTNEAFAGPAGLEKFEKDLDDYITHITKPADPDTPVRLVLVSPIAHEDLHRPGLTDGKEHNANLQRYTDAMRQVAGRRGVVFVDLFTPSQALMTEAATPLTINGIHLTDAGDRRIAAILDESLFGPRPSSSADYERLRVEVNEKNHQFWYDHRAVNGNFIYGAHFNSFGQKNFPDEFKKLRKIIDLHDRRIWTLARGQGVPETLDDRASGVLDPVQSTFTEPIKLLPPEDAIKTFTMAAGFEINLFASEVEFPDLKKPVAMAFDARGRMWVTTMPSYPMYLPGQPVNDKVLILEDTKNSGKADQMTVFADRLYLPTGIALGNGGAYVGCQPNVLFLKMSKETGQVESREVVLEGFGSTDSHRAVNTFRWGPDGALYFNEGVYNYTQVETPNGPLRNFNGGIYRYQPKSEKLELHVNYKFGNPWGHVWDRWGQDFIADAADGSNYFAAPLTGRVSYPFKHPEMKDITGKEVRPTCGSAIVLSRHFPDDWQGDFLLNNTMTPQGVFRYKLKDDGDGFSSKSAGALLTSSDPNFRPVDIQFGPDGALYVCDWHNPIIGYINHSLRDPARDKTHGRIWRITCKGRPLVEKPKIAGASIPALLELLKSPEEYTRDQARRELRLYDAKVVAADLDKRIVVLSSEEPRDQQQLLEVLWICQQHDYLHEALLKRLLRSSEYRARAAATRVLSDWRDRLPDSMELLRVQAGDEHPRVRMLAVCALSQIDTDEARAIIKTVKVDEKDYYLKYAIDESLITTQERQKRQAAALPAGKH